MKTKTDDIYMTREQAEEMVMAVEVGVYNIDQPGARSRLAHARLLVFKDENETLSPISSTLDP